MTTEQRKAVNDRLEKVERGERRLWADFSEVKAKKEAISNEWLSASNELEFLKKLVALPDEPDKTV